MNTDKLLNEIFKKEGRKAHLKDRLNNARNYSKDDIEMARSELVMVDIELDRMYEDYDLIKES